MKRILIAGIGNMFHGDDGFGCQVINELKKLTLGEELSAIDFGIRSYDLAYALTDGYDAVILVDAVARGENPGTVYLIEPDLDDLKNAGSPAADPHSMNPASVLLMAQSIGSIQGKIYLVGCEPATLGGDQGEMGLSEAVRGAIPGAAYMIQSLAAELLAEPSEKREPLLT